MNDWPTLIIGILLLCLIAVAVALIWKGIGTKR